MVSEKSKKSMTYKIMCNSLKSLKQHAIKFVNLHRTINILVQFLVEKLQRIIICIIFSIAFMTNTTLHCQKFCLRLPRGCPGPRGYSEAIQRLPKHYKIWLNKQINSNKNNQWNKQQKKPSVYWRNIKKKKMSGILI